MIPEHVKENTLREYERMAAHPEMEPMSMHTLSELGAALGYRLETDRARSDAMGAYINTLNGDSYAAFGVTWTDTRTGLSFAHVDANCDRLPELQDLRARCAVLYRGRIVEA